MSVTRITVGHSPDTDDVFMFWALATERLPTPGREYMLVAKDIEVLNREAMAQVHDVTAISYGAYPFLHRYYELVDSGGSIGDGYGPVLVAKRSMSIESLRGRRIAVPGRLTTAYLAARLMLPEFEAVEIPFKEVTAAVESGQVDAGLLIHEGQLTWEARGLVKLVDLGALWKEQESLPLPLGANAVSREFDRRMRAEIASDLKKSIVYGLEHLDEALEYTMARCPGLDRSGAERYLSMYVNNETVSASPTTRRAVHRLFERARDSHVLDEGVTVDFIDG